MDLSRPDETSGWPCRWRCPVLMKIPHESIVDVDEEMGKLILRYYLMKCM